MYSTVSIQIYISVIFNSQERDFGKILIIVGTLVCRQSSWLAANVFCEPRRHRNVIYVLFLLNTCESKMQFPLYTSVTREFWPLPSVQFIIVTICIFILIVLNIPFISDLKPDASTMNVMTSDWVDGVTKTNEKMVNLKPHAQVHLLSPVDKCKV